MKLFILAKEVEIELEGDLQQEVVLHSIEGGRAMCFGIGGYAAGSFGGGGGGRAIGDCRTVGDCSVR